MISGKQEKMNSSHLIFLKKKYWTIIRTIHINEKNTKFAVLYYQNQNLILFSYPQQNGKA